MPYKVGISSKGIEEISQALERLGKGLRASVLERALNYYAKPWVDEWRSMAPQPGKPKYTGPGRGRRKGKGGLADAIGSKVVSRPDGYIVTLIVGADYAIAPHEHLVEKGHDIIIGRQGIKQTRKSFRGRTIIAPPEVLKAMGYVTETERAARRGGRVPGGWYGRKAGRSTRPQSEASMMQEIEREITKALTVYV
jgi:hypothetical protein